MRRAPIEQVKASVEGWLARRGFEPVAAPLFACEGARERGVYLFGNADWTIVVFSEREEERRLVQELMGLERPLLHVWLFDSDVWGYVLVHDGGTLAEFDSNPDYDKGAEYFLDEPRFGDMRSGAPAELCRVLERPGLEDEVARLQRRRPVFKETAVHAFCDRLGIGPVATSYRYLEHADVDGGFAGWTVECLRYSKEDPHAGDGIDLHAESAFAAPELRDEPPAEHAAPGLPLEIPLQIRATFAMVKTLMLPFLLIVRPLAWLFRMRARLGLARLPIPVGPLVRLPGHPPLARAEDGFAMNDRHRCRVRLPEGAEIVEPTGLASRAGVWTVFALKLADDSYSSCDAHRLTELRDITRHGTAVEDERYHVGPLKARRRLIEFPARGGQEPAREEVHIVQAPRAFYVWRVAGRDAKQRAAVRRIVESFELVS